MADRSPRLRDTRRSSSLRSNGAKHWQNHTATTTYVTTHTLAPPTVNATWQCHRGFLPPISVGKGLTVAKKLQEPSREQKQLYPCNSADHKKLIGSDEHNWGTEQNWTTIQTIETKHVGKQRKRETLHNIHDENHCVHGKKKGRHCIKRHFLAPQTMLSPPSNTNSESNEPWALWWRQSRQLLRLTRTTTRHADRWGEQVKTTLWQSQKEVTHLEKRTTFNKTTLQQHLQ